METYINYNGHFAIDFVAGSDEYNTWSTFALVPAEKPVAVPPAIQGGTLTAGNGEWRFYLKDNEESYSQYLDIIADIDRKNFTVRLHHSPDDITEYEEYTAFITVGAPQTDENHTIITILAVLYPSAAEWAEHDEELSITFGADQSTSYNTWTDWHLIPDETLKIVPPQLKEKYVDIPGRNGAIDLCNAVVGLPRFERMTGSLSFTIYDNDPDAIYNDMLDNLHGHKFDEVEIMGKSYDGRWVIESYEPDGEESKITLGYNLILHDWTFNEDPDATGEVDIVGNNYYAEVFFLDKREFCLSNSLCRLIPCNSSSVYIYNINWSTDNWEIGIAFKRTTNNAKAILFGQGHDGWNWHYVPNCEVFDSGVLNVYYSSSGSNWNPAYNAAINPNAGNDWMFVKVAYDPTDKTLTLSYTKDFETFIDNVATDIYLYSNTDPMAIGYFPGYNYHTNSDMHFDLYNCYIKKDDELIWGCNTNEFPESQVSS